MLSSPLLANDWLPEGVGFLRQIFSEQELWTSYTEWSYHAGNKRTLVDGNWMVPLFQDNESLLFADLRGRFDDHGSTEGNWGLAYRRILETNEDWIVGGYGYYASRRTSNHNAFDQVTLGIEAFSVTSEIRANGYIPTSSAAKGTASAAGGAALVGNTIFVFGGLERAYYGLDAEYGRLLRDWQGGQRELRGFVGGYHFDTADSQFPNASGPKARLEWRACDLDFFGEGSRLTLGVEYQWDRVRNDQYIGMVQLRIPLGRPQRWLSRLERRMTDRIVRDIDVVSTDGYGTEIGVEPFSGHLLNQVVIIDANTPDVQAAIDATGDHASIFLDGSQGPIEVNDSLTTRTGQLLFSAGSDFRGHVGGAQGVLPGTRAAIVNLNSEADTLLIEPDVVARHFDVIGGDNGVTMRRDGRTRIPFTERSVIDSLHISQTNYYGLNFGAVNGLIQNTISTQNASLGFYVKELNGRMINNLAIDNHAGGGFTIDTMNAGAQFLRNTAEQNGIWGFIIGDQEAGSVVQGNRAIRNESVGFAMSRQDHGSRFTQNEARENRDQGFFISAINGEFDGNLAISNQQQGFSTTTLTTHHPTGIGAGSGA